MEILWWLLPAALVTAAAMAWVSWVGREGRGEVDRDEAVRRLGRALESPARRRYDAAPAERDRSTGVAVRRPARSTSPTSPTTSPREARGTRHRPRPGRAPGEESPQRRAS